LENRIDHRLIERCLKEDQRAQSELYKLLYKLLIGTCWRYATDKEQAIEYMNIGFVRILLNLKQYRPEVPFELWARRVTISNTAIELNTSFSVKLVEVGNESNVIELTNCSATFGFAIQN
jgi:hypothetical protein